MNVYGYALLMRLSSSYAFGLPLQSPEEASLQEEIRRIKAELSKVGTHLPSLRRVLS